MECILKIVLGISLMLSLSQAYAIENNSGFHFGEGRYRAGVLIGNSEVNIDNIDSVSSAAIYIEVDIIKYVSFRLGYRDIDNFTTSTATRITLDYSENFNLGLNFSYANSSPVTPYLGIQWVDWDLQASGVGEVLGEVDGTEFGGLIGVRFDIGKTFGVNMEYSQINNIDDGDIEHLQFGIYVHF